MNQEISKEALELHRQLITIDGHCDTLLGIQRGYLDFINGFKQPEDPKYSDLVSHIDLPRMKAGGHTTQAFACFIEKEFLPSDATNQALRLMDCLFQQVEASDDFEFVKSAAEIRAVKKAGKTSGFLAIEGAEALEGDVKILRNLYRLGLRQVGLTWNWRNQAADGLGEIRTGGGLTEFGVEMVKECNRLGVILDVAHLAPAGIRDIFEISEQPIVDSHCGAKGVTDNIRNLDDEQLDAMAKNGGVVCVTYVPFFISNKVKSFSDKGVATIDDVISHIDYIVKRIGIDHVGIGSDNDGFDDYLVGLEDVSKLPNLTAALLAHGYKPDEVAKIMGGNYLRVIEQVCG